MARVLVIYASTHGHTAKIAARVAAALEEAGAEPDVREIHESADVRPSDYDGAIAGASIHTGHHQREMVDWARHHHAALNGMPSAFFSVCLTAADDDEESRAATREYLDQFADDSGWTPSQALTFAGALQYREYDFATRLVMRLLMKRGDHRPT